MNKEGKEKYDCKECDHYDYCSHALNGCSLFKKKHHIILEIDGVRHVLIEDSISNLCSCCSLKGLCDQSCGAVCVALDASRLNHFEPENNEG